MKITKEQRRQLECYEKAIGTPIWRRVEYYIFRRTWACVILWLVVTLAISAVLEWLR